MGSAVRSDGTEIWAWGRNDSGQLGDGTLTRRLSPGQVRGLSEVVAIAAGSYHSLAVKTDGTVWAWGWNQYGQLGDGTFATRLAPVQVNGLSGVVGVAAGRYHSLALKSDGTVWAWGWNDSGQLGDKTFATRLAPVQVSELSGVVGIAAGSVSQSLAGEERRISLDLGLESIRPAGRSDDAEPFRARPGERVERDTRNRGGRSLQLRG